MWSVPSEPRMEKKMADTHPRIEVVLLFHSAKSGQFWRGALTLSEAHRSLRRLAADLGAKLKITVVDWKDSRKPYVVGSDIEVVDIRSRDILKRGGFWRLVRPADVVIDIGAGDSFADIYGPARLRRMFAMKFLDASGPSTAGCGAADVRPLHQTSVASAGAGDAASVSRGGQPRSAFDRGGPRAWGGIG